MNRAENTVIWREKLYIQSVISQLLFNRFPWNFRFFHIFFVTSLALVFRDVISGLVRTFSVSTESVANSFCFVQFHFPGLARVQPDSTDKFILLRTSISYPTSVVMVTMTSYFNNKIPDLTARELKLARTSDLWRINHRKIVQEGLSILNCFEII